MLWQHQCRALSYLCQFGQVGSLDVVVLHAQIAAGALELLAATCQPTDLLGVDFVHSSMAFLHKQSKGDSRGRLPGLYCACAFPAVWAAVLG